MSQQQAPRLSHVGLYVRDVPKMIDFYTNVLVFVVSGTVGLAGVLRGARSPAPTDAQD